MITIGPVEPVEEGIPMGRYFVVWLRPPGSVMPWRLLCDRGGRAVTRHDRAGADEMALRAMDGGSVCAVVGETLLPLERDTRLYARLSGGVMREHLTD